MRSISSITRTELIALIVGVLAIATLVVVVLGLLPFGGPDGDQTSSPSGETTATPRDTRSDRGAAEPVTVAFIADQGMTEESRDVLRLIDREEADVVVHSGDFDYQHDPRAWDAMINETLGPEFPYVATIGDHDREAWSGYQRVIRNRVQRADGLNCTGKLGLRSTCTYENVSVVQTSDGICDYPEDINNFSGLCKGLEDADYEEYTAQQLANANTTWQICSWHRPHHTYQVGDKGTTVPLEMYDTCREGGAIVATGHNHAYGRTYAMRNFSERSIADRSPPYTVGEGTSFAVVSGLGGKSFYEPTNNTEAPWWADTYTNGSFGAFFCTLYPDGTGQCYFKNTDGTVVDGPFAVESANASHENSTAAAG